MKTKLIFPGAFEFWAVRSLFIISILLFIEPKALAHDQRADTLVRQATDLYRKGKPLEAIDKCKLALGLGERSDASFLWGLALIKQGQHREAIRLLERAQGDPGARHQVPLQLIHFALGKCHNELGDMNASIAAFSAATGLAPGEQRYWEALAAAYDKAGRPADAIEARKKATAPAPNRSKRNGFKGKN